MSSFVKIFSLIIVSLIIVNAQTVNVTPGDGTLKAAINSASAGTTLLLTPGATYTESVDPKLIISKSLTIKVDGPVGSTKPIVKILTPVTPPSTSDFFWVQKNTTFIVDGIEFDGNNTVTTFISFDLQGSTTAINVPSIKILNCKIHHILKEVLNGASSELQGGMVVNDSIFVNNCFIHDVGPVLHYKYAGVKYMEVKNSTFAVFGGYGIRVVPSSNGGTSPWAIVDHVTMEYGMPYAGNLPKNFITVDIATAGIVTQPWTVTNSIFTNLNASTNKGLYWKNCTGQITLSKLCIWNIGRWDWSTITNVTITDTLPMYPNYADTAARNYTLPLNSVLRTYGTGGTAIGDPRWASTTSIRELPYTVAQYELQQNYPNPFNPSTVINFSIKESGFVRLIVYNNLGEIVSTLVEKNMNKGSYSVDFNAENNPAGIYFYRLICNNQMLTKKMILIK